jgi:hypothetical protein
VRSRAWAFAGVGLVLALSLGLKVLTSPYLGLRGPPPVSAGERLHAFLLASASEPVAAVSDGGWRLGQGDCWLMAFPSGERGELDAQARNHARLTDRIAYVYRGRVADRPPVWDYAFAVVGYFLARPFRNVSEPGYVVLIRPKACGPFPDLPWSAL